MSCIVPTQSWGQIFSGMSEVLRSRNLNRAVSLPPGAIEQEEAVSGSGGVAGGRPGKDLGLSHTQWEPWMVLEQERHMPFGML